MLNFFQCRLIVLYLTTIIHQHQSSPTESYLEIQPRMLSARPVTDLRYPFLIRVIVHELLHPDDPNDHTNVFSLAHGTLLSPRWVLTSAKYLSETSADQVSVVAGSSEKLDIITENPGVVQKRHVKGIFIHPKFRSVRGNHYWDLALLLLVQPMLMTEWVRSIGFKAIPNYVAEDSMYKKHSNTSCKMAGMGMTCNDHDKDIASNKLGEITVRLVDTYSCYNLKQIPALNNTFLCAYSHYSAGYRGDIGVPLLCGSDFIGVFQGGQFNCETPQESRMNRFTRMDKAKPWMATIIKQFLKKH